MLIEQHVEVYVNSSNKKYFIKKGYQCGKNGTKILVDAKDLKPSSKTFVKIKCDFCGKIFERKYVDYYNSEFRDLDACRDCTRKKVKLITEIKYGVSNTSQLNCVKEKFKKTCMEKYGSEHFANNEKIKQKKAETCMKKYGNEYAIGSDKVRKKIKKTFREKYGVDNPSQIDWVMEKIVASRYKNGCQACSKQQRFLGNSLSGIVNYPYKRFFIDVAFPDEMIAVEYIGGGHNLSVKLGEMTQKEFDRNENFRRKILFESEWKLIEFISLKNNIPNKEVCKNIFEFCKYLFSKENKHYIKVYIDEDKITSGNDKICYKNTLNDWNESSPL